MRRILVILWFSIVVMVVISSSPKRKEKKRRKKKAIVGIDLGTTFSCVSIYRNGKVEIIPNLAGYRTTPSVVSWSLDDGKMLVGRAAKNNAVFDPENTFYDVKRLIGRKFTEVLKKDVKLLSYELTPGEENQLLMKRVTKSGKELFYSPEEISAFVLDYLKRSAEQFLNVKITEAVITVPAYFNDQQRQATKDAGKIAGLNVRRIVNEPTAASMTYGLEKFSEHNILVFDLGGGTFDVSLLTIERGLFQVIATSGDMHLGGEDFDLKIVEYIDEQWIKKNGGKGIANDKKAFQRLKRAAEDAKIALSTEFETEIFLENYMDGKDLRSKLTRAKFESLCYKNFQNTLKPVARVLRDSDMMKHEVHEVVLVGGSTRIPKVQQILSDYFNGKTLHKEVDPDEAVAYGAGIQGAIINRIIQGENKVILLDVNALSLGVETAGGTMSTIIPRNTQIPCTKSEQYTTSHNNQEMIKIPVYEGERKKAKENRLLGEFELKGIQRAPKGVPKIIITFKLDTNGILTCTAEDVGSKVKSEQTFVKGTLSPEEIERMTRDADMHKESDLDEIKKVKLNQMFNEYIDVIKKEVTKPETKKMLSSEEIQKIKKNIVKANRWLRKYEDKANFEQFEKQFTAFKNYITPILLLDFDDKFSIEALEEEVERQFGNTKEEEKEEEVEMPTYGDDDEETSDDYDRDIDVDIDVEDEEDDDDEPYFKDL